MKRSLGVLLLLLAHAAWSSDDPPGCAWLCGDWVLDATRSDAAEPVIDAALAKFREPEPRKPRKPRDDDPLRDPAPDAAPTGPVFDRPTKAQMRTQLLTLLTPPASLVLGEKGNEILIRAGDGPERRIFPGEPHSRVDAQGTAKIRADWKKDALVVNEAYSGKHEQTETYELLPDGTLQVTLVVERAEARTMRLRSVYRRR